MIESLAPDRDGDRIEHEPPARARDRDDRLCGRGTGRGRMGPQHRRRRVARAVHSTHIRSLTRDQAVWVVRYALASAASRSFAYLALNRRSARHGERDRSCRPACRLGVGPARRSSMSLLVGDGRRSASRCSAWPMGRRARSRHSASSSLSPRPRRSAAYIVAGKRIGKLFEGLNGLALALLVAAAIQTPLGTRAGKAGHVGARRPRDPRGRWRPCDADPVRARDDRPAEPVDGHLRAAPGVRARDRAIVGFVVRGQALRRSRSSGSFWSSRRRRRPSGRGAGCVGSADTIAS